MKLFIFSLRIIIIADVDVILTGDKDFLCLDMEYPKCANVSEFKDMEELIIGKKIEHLQSCWYYGYL